MNTHQPRETSFRFFSKPLFHPHTPFLPTPQSLSFPTNSFNMFSITALVVARYWQIDRLPDVDRYAVIKQILFICVNFSFTLHINAHNNVMSNTDIFMFSIL